MADKFQKIGAWLWANKERLVLIIMVLVLGYRGYRIINPPPPPQWTRYQAPRQELPEDRSELKDANIELPGVPKMRPAMDVPGSYIKLYEHNPFWYHSGKKSNDDDTGVTVEQLNVTLVDIQKTGTKVRAKLKTSRTSQWHSENDQFEEFVLQRINPDDDTVEIYSTRYARTFTLQKGS